VTKVDDWRVTQTIGGRRKGGMGGLKVQGSDSAMQGKSPKGDGEKDG